MSNEEEAPQSNTTANADDRILSKSALAEEGFQRILDNLPRLSISQLMSLQTSVAVHLDRALYRACGENLHPFSLPEATFGPESGAIPKGSGKYAAQHKVAAGGHSTRQNSASTPPREKSPKAVGPSKRAVPQVRSAEFKTAQTLCEKTKVGLVSCNASKGSAAFEQVSHAWECAKNYEKVVNGLEAAGDKAVSYTYFKKVLDGMGVTTAAAVQKAVSDCSGNLLPLFKAVDLSTAVEDPPADMTGTMKVHSDFLLLSKTTYGSQWPRTGKFLYIPLSEPDQKIFWKQLKREVSPAQDVLSLIPQGVRNASVGPTSAPSVGARK